MPVTPVLRGLSQEDHELKASLSYVTRKDQGEKERGRQEEEWGKKRLLESKKDGAGREQDQTTVAKIDRSILFF